MFSFKGSSYTFMFMELRVCCLLAQIIFFDGVFFIENIFFSYDILDCSLLSPTPSQFLPISLLTQIHRLPFSLTRKQSPNNSNNRSDDNNCNNKNKHSRTGQNEQINKEKNTRSSFDRLVTIISPSQKFHL